MSKFFGTQLNKYLEGNVQFGIYFSSKQERLKTNAKHSTQESGKSNKHTPDRTVKGHSKDNREKSVKGRTK